VALDEMDGKVVDEFVRDYTSALELFYLVDRGDPFHIRPALETLLLSLSDAGDPFDEEVFQGVAKICCGRIKYGRDEGSFAGADLDDRETIGATAFVPDLFEPARPQVSECRIQFGRGQVVPSPTGPLLARGVVPVPGVIERQRHERGERHGAMTLDVVDDDLF
jgi:hypothetical protein